MINDEIKRLKALHQKPVYAVVEETCASAAYYIAVAADEIYVDKASIVGSIGVLMDGFDIRRAAVEARIPCLTSLDTAGALAVSIAHGGTDFEILPITEYGARK